MTSIIAFGGTKGGVGKTALSRAVAVESQRKGAEVVGIDLNPKQCTFARWAELRRNRGVEPEINVLVASNADHAIELAHESNANLAVIDAPGEADSGTLKIAHAADLFVQVASRSLDDHAQVREYIESAGHNVLDFFVRDLRGYRNNHNAGLAITEASHLGPRLAAQRVVNELIDLLVSRSA